MKLKLTTNSSRAKSPNRQNGSLCLLAVLFVVITITAKAQTFSSGSNGSDGVYAPTGPSGTVILFDPTQFHGTQVAANIFNFTTITIPAGVTVKLSGNTINGPIFWLAQGDVDIEGTLDLSGGDGAAWVTSTTSFERQPSVPGSGGFPGGVGGNATQAPLAGGGTGGGAAASISTNALGGTFSGNQLVIPLVGGSGGGGAFGASSSILGSAGGAGGGAVLIASSTRIIVNGAINANGGRGGSPNGTCPAGGSGGAMRLVSNLITGSGTLTAQGSGTIACGDAPGGPGLIREESSTTFFPGNVSGTLVVSTPIQLLLPTAGPATASVISINGTPVTPNPSTFPDITINTTAAVPVIIQTQNIPATATISLTILDENNVPDTVIQAPPLSNCTSNICTTTVNVTFPFGGSFGLTKVNWTVQ